MYVHVHIYNHTNIIRVYIYTVLYGGIYGYLTSVCSIPLAQAHYSCAD